MRVKGQRGKKKAKEWRNKEKGKAMGCVEVYLAQKNTATQAFPSVQINAVVRVNTCFTFHLFPFFRFVLLSFFF